jgi:hypothetical protein
MGGERGEGQQQEAGTNDLSGVQGDVSHRATPLIRILGGSERKLEGCRTAPAMAPHMAAA